MISNIFLIIFIILFIILFVVFQNYKNKTEKEKDQILNSKFEELKQKFKQEQQIEIDYYEKEKREIEQKKEQLYNDYEQEKNNIENLRINNRQIVEQLSKQEELLKEQLNTLQEQKDTLLKNQAELINQELTIYKEQELTKIQNFLEQKEKENKNELENKIAKQEAALAQKLEEKEHELLQVENLIEDYRKKEQVIHEAILRQRAIDEQQDFYRVCLSEESIQDIKLLRDIMNKLNLKDHLNKLIYDTYISKPTQEMIKRVLQGEDPSGIYKITRLKTGEIYIGKSTGIKSRWTQHCKTAFDVGTIAHSILHTTIKKDGLENFTFEVVEYVPKDKLSEREKFWIDFYHSKQYGLNEKGG